MTMAMAVADAHDPSRFRGRSRVALGRHAQQQAADTQEILGIGGALEA